MTKSILPAAAMTQHLAVLGKTGSGKSSVLRSLVEGRGELSASAELFD